MGLLSMMAMDKLIINDRTMSELEELYNKAIADGETILEFQGNQVYTRFAYYILKYYKEK
jgi:hypothetical protein